MKCEMIKFKFNMDGDIDSERPCGEKAIGITEDKVPVCGCCAEQMKKEGFRVDPLGA